MASEAENKLKQAKALRLKQQLSARQQASGGESTFKRLDDFVRSMASGATFGLADEAAAGLSSLTGIGGQPRGGQTYEQNLAAERERDAGISPWVGIPGEVAGGVLTGAGLAKGGATLLAGAKPTLGSLAPRAAAEGAAYGAAHGAGHAPGGERLEAAGEGAALGGAFGAGMGVIGRAIAARPKAKDIKDMAAHVKDQSRQAYEAAENAGVIVKADRVSRLTSEIQRKIARAGVDQTLHPKALAAYGRLEQAAQQNQTLEGMDILRRVLKGAASSTDPDERRIAMIMIDEFDDFMGGLRTADVVAGDAAGAVRSLNDARKLWSTGRKADFVGDLVERAGNRAGQFSGSGFENALRTEFRQVVQNPKKLRMFAKPEQEFMRRVARGTSLGNAMRWLGKMAPTGVVSTTLSGGAGYALGGAVGAPGVGAVALPAIGYLGRAGATASTMRNVERVLDAVLAPATRGQPVTLNPQQANLLRSFIVGEQQAVQQSTRASDQRRLPKQ